MKKLFIYTLVLIVLMGLISCQEHKDSYEIAVKEFNKHGNVILDVSFEELEEKNIEIADIISVTIGDNCYDLPIGTEYSDVDSGQMICRYDLEQPKVILAINGGNFAESTQMATKETIEEEPGYKWNVSIDKVSISLKTKNGYRDEYDIRHLVRTNDRLAYGSLNNDEYANCRVISSTGVKENMLFRGSTPLDEDMERNIYAMEFINNHNIQAIINLTDSEQEMKEYNTFNNSYYSTCTIANIVMDYDFTGEAFQSKVRECVKFINDNDGPFYIHCKEGKDRTGILCAIIECYLGSTYEEIADDYMKTFENYYFVEKDSEMYNTILSSNLDKILKAIFEVDDLSIANLKEEAKEYLLLSGLTNDELNNLANKLGK